MDNRNTLAARPVWARALWVVVLANEVQSEGFKFSMNIFNLVHAHSFMAHTPEQFADGLLGSFRQLQLMTANQPVGELGARLYART